MKTVWLNNKPTPYGITVYTCGDCWVLAYYLAKQLESRIGFVGGSRWGHAVAQVPGTNKFIDILGLHTRQKLLSNSLYLWRGVATIEFMEPPRTFPEYTEAVYEFTDRHNIGDWEYSKLYGPSYRTARETASKLIRKYVN